MRLIDADALYKAMNSSGWFDNTDRDEVALGLVSDAPTVEVETSKGCKYCLENESLQEYKQGKRIEAYIDIDGRTLTAELYEYRMSVEINFCPMCGRKLLEDV